jgi:leucyl aminopeptidase
MELPKVQFIQTNSTGLLNTLESNQSSYDGLIVIFTEKKALVDLLPQTQKYMNLDATFGESVQLLVTNDGKPAERVIISPTGTIDGDFDDVRRIKG